MQPTKITIDGIDYTRTDLATQAPSKPGKGPYAKYAGRYCVVRINKAGVMCGIVEKVDSGAVHFASLKRIWSWAGALCIEDIASKGVASGKTAKSGAQSIRWEEGGQIAIATDAAAAKIEALL